MTDPTDKVEAFLSANPNLELVEAVLPDLAGGLRGKWITRDKLAAAFDGELKLPVSATVFDSWGRDVETWVFAGGDGDGRCCPDADSLAVMPWAARPMGQVLMSIGLEDGSPNPLDPRNVLRRLQARFNALDMHPVVASEMEFVLLHAERDAQGRPRHTQTDSLGGALGSGQTYGLEAMASVEDYLHDVRDACALQSLPVDALIKESAPSQYEINLLHRADALQAADQALLLQRLIRGVARGHDMIASFMAKPFGDLPGNGMHLHCSLIDGTGRNLFDDGSEAGSDLLRHAIAGCLETLPDVMLLLAPNFNSYRRFQRGMHSPLAPCWGYENRTVAVRVPLSDGADRRIEHRVAGADAQPHLAVAALLAGMLYGIENQLEPPPAIEGNAYEQLEPTLPRHWEDALERFRTSRFVAEYFGASLQEVFSLIKQQEIDEFARHVSPLEYDTNL